MAPLIRAYMVLFMVVVMLRLLAFPSLWLVCSLHSLFVLVHAWRDPPGLRICFLLSSFGTSGTEVATRLHGHTQAGLMGKLVKTLMSVMAAATRTAQHRIIALSKIESTIILCK
jgi:hypothetical protein